MADQVAVAEWTCDRCEVTASWMPGVQRPELPVAWIEQGGEIYCLHCRRELAGEAGLVGVAEDVPADKRQQLRSRARVEFEVERDPDRGDGQIAQACRTSIPAVKKARVRLGLQTRGRRRPRLRAVARSSLARTDTEGQEGEAR